VNRLRQVCTAHAVGAEAGSILLEVVLATLLVAILVVPLASAFASALDGTRDVRYRAGETPVVGTGGEAADSWEWGPRVLSAWWRPGPVLHIRLSGSERQGSTRLRLGLWADGWLLVEKDVTIDGPSGTASAEDLQIGPESWTGMAESELVLRVRDLEGVWGPPWRLFIPGAGGGSPAPGSALASSAGEPTVVVHRPGAGSSPLSASWTASALTAPPLGLLFVLRPAIQGWGAATLDGRAQWWWMEEGRSVDVYY
jgi:hypothetical protein